MELTKAKHACIVLIVAFLAAGCATAPGPNLYTLNMAPASGDSGGVQIAVGRLRIAEALQNKRILIKKSPTEIEYYAAAQWAAGLDELLAEKLGVEFGQPDASGAASVLSGTLLAFEQVDSATGAEAHVRLAIEIRKEGTSYYSPPALAKTYDVRLPVAAPTAGVVVEALSACLEQVAQAIVADTSALG